MWWRPRTAPASSPLITFTRLRGHSAGRSWSPACRHSHSCSCSSSGKALARDAKAFLPLHLRGLVLASCQDSRRPLTKPPRPARGGRERHCRPPQGSTHSSAERLDCLRPSRAALSLPFPRPRWVLGGSCRLSPPTSHRLSPPNGTARGTAPPPDALCARTAPGVQQNSPGQRGTTQEERYGGRVWSSTKHPQPQRRAAWVGALVSRHACRSERARGRPSWNFPAPLLRGRGFDWPEEERRWELPPSGEAEAPRSEQGGRGGSGSDPAGGTRGQGGASRPEEKDLGGQAERGGVALTHFSVVREVFPVSHRTETRRACCRGPLCGHHGRRHRWILFGDLYDMSRGWRGWSSGRDG